MRRSQCQIGHSCATLAGVARRLLARTCWIITPIPMKLKSVKAVRGLRPYKHFRAVTGRRPDAFCHFRALGPCGFGWRLTPFFAQVHRTQPRAQHRSSPNEMQTTCLQVSFGLRPETPSEFSKHVHLHAVRHRSQMDFGHHCLPRNSPDQSVPLLGLTAGTDLPVLSSLVDWRHCLSEHSRC